jgi:uracil-DNA glycosylase
MTQDSLLGPKDIATLRVEAAGCTACDLYRDATQTVFGEGEGADVRMVMVGEQPGDQEDVQGRPFVGPAGGVLDRALEEAGIDRAQTYVTNTVKHFKWTPKPVRGPGFRGTGKRRIHQKPNAEEIAACRPWLDAELEVLAPDLVVLLGATAAQALLGRDFRVTRQHGEVVEGPGGIRCLATIHPSAVLRADEAQRKAAYDGLVADLRAAAKALAELG